MSKAAWVAVIVLLLGGIGLIVYTQKHGAVSTKSSQVASQGKPAAGAPQGQSQPTTAPGTSVEVQKLLASIPGESATKEQISAWNQRMAAEAVKGGVLDVTGCLLNPPAFSVKAGEKFKIKNTGKSTRVISHPKGITFIAEAESTKDVNLPIATAPGTYGFSCDGKMAGIIYVAQ